MKNIIRISYVVLICLLFIVGCSGQKVKNQQLISLNDLVVPDSIEKIATGYRFTEGPVWHPDGYLLFSDIPGNTIYKWTQDGETEIFRSPSGYSNGLIFDKQGRLLACEHGNRRVSRTGADGSIVTLVSEFEKKRLNSPNDAVVRSDGSIYFTDPPYGLTGIAGTKGEQELSFQGVYRIMPESSTLELIVDDIHRPNGIALSPNEEVLYVANTQSPASILAFDIKPDGTLANRRTFAQLDGWEYPDGITVDLNGNLYVTANSFLLKVYKRFHKKLYHLQQ